MNAKLSMPLYAPFEAGDSNMLSMKLDLTIDKADLSIPRPLHARNYDYVEVNVPCTDCGRCMCNDKNSCVKY